MAANPEHWFSGMSVPERRTFWACFAGWALDAMDFQTYAVVMPTLVGLWGLTGGQAGMLGTSALLTSPIGGWAAGVLADRIGRVRVLRISIIWFATFSFLSGFTNSFPQLLVTRSLQGIGFGGEWVAGMVLISEVVRKGIRGRAVGSVQSGWAVGYGAAVLLFTGTFILVSPAHAWRLLFFIGLLPALPVLWITREIEEPEIFKKNRSAPKKQTLKFLEIFQPHLLSNTLLASLLATGALGANYITLTWLPAYLKTTRGLSVLDTGGYLAVQILGTFLGYFASAHLNDVLGRRRTFVINSLLAAGTIAVYTFSPLDNLVILFLGFPLGFFQSGIVAGMGVTFSELFPTRVRAGGQGFSYNVGRGLGSAMPALVGYMSGTRPLGVALGTCALCSYGLVLIAVAFLHETRGIELETYDTEVRQALHASKS